MTRAAAQPLVCAALAAAAGWIALVLFGFDSDGALAIHDGAYYGMGAERDPLNWFLPHHPLFHGIAAALTPPLRALGFAHPGHVAIRVISGLGGIWLLFQIVRLAGRERALAGGAFALLLLATRGFIVDTAAGETVIPGAAAALFALRIASRPEPRPWAAGAALTFAVLLRLDNVLVLPGVAAGLAAASPAGRRASTVAAVAACAGLASLVAYVGAWMIGKSSAIPFDRWLLPIGLNPWMGAPGLTPHRFALYATSIVIATAGQTAPFGTLLPWTGLGIVGAIGAAGLLLRGTAPDRRVVAPILLTLASRALFHTWFEADNFEWLMFPVAAVIALAAANARGVPATGPAARAAGGLVIAGLVGWMLGTHLPSTWELRGRAFMSAVEEAVGPDAAKLRFLSQGETPATALALLGVDHTSVLEVPFQPQATAHLIQAELEARPVDTVVVLTDRYVVNGQPWVFAHRQDGRLPDDALPDTGFVRFFRREGITIAVRIRPDPHASRPESR